MVLLRLQFDIYFFVKEVQRVFDRNRLGRGHQFWQNCKRVLLKMQKFQNFEWSYTGNKFLMAISMAEKGFFTSVGIHSTV